MKKTYTAKPLEVERKWIVIDAEGQTLGRLATQIATYLRGKHKPEFTPHVDTGDFVIVINGKGVKVTGKKPFQKKYYHNTGYPGGLRITNFEDLLAKSPAKLIETAVWGMIPHTSLGRDQIRKLHVYAGAEHPHQAQKPVSHEFSEVKHAS